MFEVFIQFVLECCATDIITDVTNGKRLLSNKLNNQWVIENIACQTLVTMVKQ